MADKFSNKNVGKASLREKAKDINNRLADLEKVVAHVMRGTDQRLSNIGAALNGINDILDAVMELVGREEVQRIVEEKQRERDQAQADSERQNLMEAVADGYVTQVDVIGENSLLVGEEVLPSGKPLGVGYQQVAFNNLEASYKEQLLGKGVGEVVKTPLGGTFTVKEIFDVDAEKGRAVLEEKARKQAEAAAQAAAEVASADEAEAQQ